MSRFRVLRRLVRCLGFRVLRFLAVRFSEFRRVWVYGCNFQVVQSLGVQVVYGFMGREVFRSLLHVFNTSKLKKG